MTTKVETSQAINEPPEDLKACPFCGCLPDCGLEDDVLMVWCDNSDCYLNEGPKFSLKAWQTRASF